MPNTVGAGSDTFLGLAADFIAQARNFVYYKNIILTDVVTGDAVFYHLPADVERLEMTVAGQVSCGGNLRYFQHLKTLRLWFVDDIAFLSVVTELKRLFRLVTLEVGWMGRGHAPECFDLLFYQLKQMKTLRQLTLYCEEDDEDFSAAIGTFNLAVGCLPLDELNLYHINMYPQRHSDVVKFPPSLGILRILHCFIPYIDFSGLDQLEVLCIMSLSPLTDGLETVKSLRNLKTLTMDNRIGYCDDAAELSECASSTFGLVLPPTWNQGGRARRRMSA